jgi:prepilin-type N-terminal cleavage/methylation domain-containing protein
MSDQRSGFTLIEVMIALTIMAALTILTTQAIRSSVSNKEKFQSDLNREAAVRDSLRIMERDINLAFHHRDVLTDMVNQAETASAQPAAGAPGTVGGAGQPTAAQLAAEQQLAAANATAQKRTPPPEYTAFLGEEDNLTFTSLSNVRMQKDSPESDEAVIGYALKDCKTTSTGKSDRAKCLFRRISPNITEDITQGGTETVLLEYVETFTLRYLGPGSDEWQKEWKTKTSKSDGKADFPYAVEITLRTHNKRDPKDKPFNMQMVAELRFPNNAAPKSGQDAQTPQAPTGK